jgi:peptidoglycan/xylan/chitin deacetylase (PgdA/CDA1 family)
VGSLVLANGPAGLWRLLHDPGENVWNEAVSRANELVDWPFDSPDSLEELLEATLGEGQFGPSRYTLGRAARVYYAALRPVLPSSLRPAIRRLWRSRAVGNPRLSWPVEERYVRFQYHALSEAMEIVGAESVDMCWFWPDGSEYALCLTHDVESRSGHDFVRTLANLDEAYGFRSCFNFVPGDYRVDEGLLDELRSRGFEIGVHGYRHDGKMFSSRERFDRDAERIAMVAREWGSVGFRSPLTHREPNWMQALEIEYDLSFFDTDPFEPMPGGTMSVWPFFLGHFVELPYTLAQDHTLLELGETSPRLWQEKVEFIRQCHGMALVNVHPDYMREPRNLAVYEEMLRWLQAGKGFWHALPRELAAWWKERADSAPPADEDVVRVERGGGELRFAQPGRER